MNYKIIQGDIFKALPLIPSDSIDAVVTSPPYWGMRSYVEKDNELKKQELGSEPTMEEYLDNTMRWVKEIYRVLKPSGSFILNIGDCFCGGGHNNFTGGRLDGSPQEKTLHYETTRREPKEGIYKAKQFLSVSSFAYCRIISETDFICRGENLWCKPNVPSPFRTRLKHSHEKLFWFVKDADDYYFNARPWLKKTTETTKQRANYDIKGRPQTLVQRHIYAEETAGKMNETIESSWRVIEDEGRERIKGERERQGLSGLYCAGDSAETIENSYRIVPVGEKQKGFELNGKMPQEHVAPFPEALVKPWVECLTPKQVCSKCGRPLKVKIVAERKEPIKHIKFTPTGEQSLDNVRSISGATYNYPTLKDKFEPSCECKVDFVPGVVLDPFNGSGTILKIARDLQLNGVGIELNPKSVEYTKSRINWGNSLDGNKYEVEEV